MDPDKELVLRAQHGDKAAFGVLFERYQESLCRFCVAILENEAEGEQVAQEVFILSWQHLNQFQGRCRFKSWLCEIAKRKCLKLLKTKKGRYNVRRPILDDLDCVPDDVTDVPKPGMEDAVISAVFVEQLLRMIMEEGRAGRPPWDALDLAIFHLRYEREVESKRAVARMLGKSEDTVKFRISHRIDPVVKAIFARWKAEEGSV